MKKNTEILIGFENLKVKVLSSDRNNVKAEVIENGPIENNKVPITNRDINLNPLTNKDIQAIKIAKKFENKICAIF